MLWCFAWKIFTTVWWLRTTRFLMLYFLRFQRCRMTILRNLLCFDSFRFVIHNTLTIYWSSRQLVAGNLPLLRNSFLFARCSIQYYFVNLPLYVSKKSAKWISCAKKVEYLKWVENWVCYGFKLRRAKGCVMLVMGENRVIWTDNPYNVCYYSTISCQ